MKKIFLIAFTCALFLCKAQSPNFDWVRQFQETYPSSGIASCVALDGIGNIYTSGRFQGVADFDPGVGTYTMSSLGGYDIFIVKLDPSGNLLWAKQIGGLANDGGQSITIDFAGNIYTTGYFQGTTDFDPGIGVFNLTPFGNSDAFISKLDLNGNFAYAKQLGGSSNVFGNSLTTDLLGNLLVSGYYDGISDFDPGIGTYTLICNGGKDVFTEKLDNMGNFLWAKSIGTFSNEESLSLKVDVLGNVYSTGYFSNVVDFDPGLGTYTVSSKGAMDFYISKLDPSGNFIFVKSLGGSYNDASFDIFLDGSNNIYVTGYFQDTVDFNPSSGVYNLICPNWADIFVLKLDVSGNFIYAKQMAGLALSLGKSISIDQSGNAYVTGWFNGKTDFDPGPGTYYLTPVGSTDIFIFKLDPTGNLAWASQFLGSSGTTGNYGQGIIVNSTGDVYSVGQFQYTIDFDPGIGTYSLTATGNTDFYVHKMCQFCPLAINESALIGNIYTFPNPTKDLVNLNLNEHFIGGSIQLFDAIGKLIQTQAIKNTTEKINLNLNSGIYFIKATTKEGVSKTEKLIIEQ